MPWKAWAEGLVRKASGAREARVAGERCRTWGAGKGTSPEEPSPCLDDGRVLRTAELLDSSAQGVMGLPCVFRVLQELLEMALGGTVLGDRPPPKSLSPGAGEGAPLDCLCPSGEERWGQAGGEGDQYPGWLLTADRSHGQCHPAGEPGLAWDRERTL